MFFFFNIDFEFQYDLSGCYYIERRASIASGIIVDSSLLLSKGHDTFAIAIISTMNKSVWYSKIAIVEIKDSFKVVLLSYLNGVLEKLAFFANDKYLIQYFFCQYHEWYVLFNVPLRWYLSNEYDYFIFMSELCVIRISTLFCKPKKGSDHIGLRASGISK